jgi:hypothetical protein
LALPVPIVGVAENSSLKEFRDQMIERHQECEVPLPDNDDLARLLLELKGHLLFSIYVLREIVFVSCITSSHDLPIIRILKIKFVFFLDFGR